MEGRGGVRCSARLSGEAARTTGGGSSGNGRAAEDAAAAAAAAAVRRARAAERAREVEDSPRVLRDKCRRLARALRNAKHLVVYTGAGISTAADIPDYRGPHGVWTRLQRGETVGRVEVSRARPTFTHMALTALWARGTLKFVVSQNCDGLHLRAGLPRRSLAELHGDMFCEVCTACRRVYVRAFDTTERTARHAHGTRRLCHACAAELRDSIVHFGERGRAAWPLNWAGALRHAARADVVLCLGSSLKVLRRYPRLWRMQSAPRARPALYIVNLQWTPKDSVAALKINARCDAVMRLVARRLRLRVPRYRARADPLLAHAEPLAEPEAHTTRRPLLTADGVPDTGSSSDPSSPSASDSDEELPLRRLAERLRPPAPVSTAVPAPAPASVPPHAHTPQSAPAQALAPAADLHRLSNGIANSAPEQADPPSSRPPRPPPLPPTPRPPWPPPASRPPGPPPYSRPPPDLLRAFQVSMRTGDATILLRARHAPCSAPTAAPRGPSLAAPLGPSLAALRNFRMMRPRPSPPPPAPAPQPAPLAAVKIKKEEADEDPPGEPKLGSRLRRLLDCEPRLGLPDRKPKPEPDDDASGSSSEGAGAGAGALAAAIWARAVLVCRASLYPGLHTIIAPAAPGPAAGAPDRRPAECAWCLRRHGSRRCLWYGPARATPPEARAWRRVRGRRYLCACCADGPGPAPAPAADADGGGWYGKGYRKGRRRRR